MALEVLRMLAAGRSNQAIAADLVVALDTVKKHVSHLLDKLGATNRTEAVARARELAPDPLTRCVHSASRRRFRARAADLTLSRFSAPPGMRPRQLRRRRPAVSVLTPVISLLSLLRPRPRGA
jgi:DNA-binding CsgD family transcriptional regulator